MTTQMKVFDVPITITASTIFKVLAADKEAALMFAESYVDSDIFETSSGGIDVENLDSKLSLDTVEVDGDAITESTDDPREHPEYDPDAEFENKDNPA